MRKSMPFVRGHRSLEEIYDCPKAADLGWLANTQFYLGLNNALDQRPPFVNQFDLNSGTLGYDPANASLLGRRVSLQVVKRWGQ